MKKILYRFSEPDILEDFGYADLVLDEEPLYTQDYLDEKIEDSKMKGLLTGIALVVLLSFMLKFILALHGAVLSSCILFK